MRIMRRMRIMEEYSSICISLIILPQSIKQNFRSYKRNLVGHKLLFLECSFIFQMMY